PVQVMHPSSLPQGINYPPTPMPRALPASVTQPEEPEQGVKAWLRKYRLCCWSSHDSPGCGSFKAECTFIFGSCRKFYGEPCLPTPAPYPPVPQGNGNPARNGCGCSW